MNKLALIFCMLCGQNSAALADRVPQVPDFQPVRSPDRDRSLAASSATTAMDPMDVLPFAFDSYRLDPVDKIQLWSVARWIARHPDARLVIEGHTDGIGGEGYNRKLATRRARAVYDALIDLGAPRERLVPAIYGKAKPPSKNPISQANRVVILYSTTMPGAQVASLTLPVGNTALWAELAPARETAMGL
jgi:outer membrane protein OmpA-like peptidoglycan-associated protein